MNLSYPTFHVRVPSKIGSTPIARALLVRTFAERGVGHVAGMQVGQLVNVGGGEGAALALGAGGLTAAFAIHHFFLSVLWRQTKTFFFRNIP